MCMHASVFRSEFVYLLICLLGLFLFLWICLATVYFGTCTFYCNLPVHFVVIFTAQVIFKRSTLLEWKVSNKKYSLREAPYFKVAVLAKWLTRVFTRNLKTLQRISLLPLHNGGNRLMKFRCSCRIPRTHRK